MVRIAASPTMASRIRNRTESRWSASSLRATMRQPAPRRTGRAQASSCVAIVALLGEVPPVDLVELLIDPPEFGEGDAPAGHDGGHLPSDVCRSPDDPDARMTRLGKDRDHVLQPSQASLNLLRRPFCA